MTLKTKRRTRYPISPTQQRLVRFVTDWWAKYQRGPSISDVGLYMKHDSPATTHEMVVKLVERGWLKWPQFGEKRCSWGLQLP